MNNIVIAHADLFPAENDLRELLFSRANDYFHNRGIKDRYDLFPFYSILVSTGWNKNTDVFDNVEIWRARHSPEDKPLNLMHNQKQIIGHIIQNIVVGEDLKPIPEDTDEGDLPYKLHIVTANVIYAFWQDKTVQEYMLTLIDEISRGEWSVSMECLFRNFDYGFLASNGEQKLLPRNDKTKYLTKYLRQYKGSGKVNNYTIGRILRDITFSAVGLVKKPANPDSIIDEKLNLFTNANYNDEKLVYINLEMSKMEQNDMSETSKAMTREEFDPMHKDLLDRHGVLEQEYKKLHKAHEMLHDDHNRLKKDHDAECEKNLQMKTRLDNIHQNTMAEKKDDTAEKFDKVEEKEEDKIVKSMKEDGEKKEKEYKEAKAALEVATAQVASLTVANDAMKATIEEFEKATRNSKRAEALMQLDNTMSKDKALQTVASFSELSDDVFNGMLSMATNFNKNKPQSVTAEEVLNPVEKEKDAQYGAKAETAFNELANSVKAFLRPEKSDKSKK